MNESYFNGVLLADGIYHIHEPGGVNTSLIIGEERAMLIDTGYGFGNLAAYVRTLTDKPLDVVLTHGHTDHSGGNYQFSTIHMNLMDTPTYLWYESTEKKRILDKLRRDRSAKGLPSLWPEDFDEDHWLNAHTKHFEPLKNGQIFDLGGRREEIIYMPGHTMGSVVIRDDRTGLLFSGDNISDSLWIFFDTSAPLSSYASNLMDLRLLSLSGIVASHREFIFPAEIIEEILDTIGRIDPETDGVFRHPRTGKLGTRHREPCRCVEDIKYIYVVYDKNRI